MSSLFPNATVSLEEQIRCVMREIAMRKSAYPRFIEKRQLTQTKADNEIAAMEAVLATLQSIKENRNA